MRQRFKEVELGREVKRFGNVATVLSSYEERAQSTAKLVTHGVNIFSLYFDGKHWWIQTMQWAVEGSGTRFLRSCSRRNKPAARRAPISGRIRT